MLRDALKGWKVILASGSPRRHQFFKELEVPFEVRLKSVDEVYPPNLQAGEISDFLAQLKAKPFNGTLKPKEILVTSDTVVWHNGASLAKAADEQEAYEMLKKLSGDWHEVVTSVSFTTAETQSTVNHITKVKLKELSDAEIWYYINRSQPFDKAGAYGIQEWIGMIGVSKIDGCFYNVMGLPITKLYDALKVL